MSDSQYGANIPVAKRVGPRRVRTEPLEGQQEEPDSPGVTPDSTDNDDRLKADKPPHY
ncbi:MAG TPA: hypothetical protein VGP34_01390 [Pontimonas sp.]|nr:hypothetical protein [Pontimonas sp.]